MARLLAGALRERTKFQINVKFNFGIRLPETRYDSKSKSSHGRITPSVVECKGNDRKAALRKQETNMRADRTEYAAGLTRRRGILGGMHGDEGATESEVLLLSRIGASRTSHSYALKATRNTPGKPMVLGEDNRIEVSGLTIPRRIWMAKSRHESRRRSGNTNSLATRSRLVARWAICRKAVSRGHSRREVSWKEFILYEPVEGPKGGRYRMVRQVVVVSIVMIYSVLVRPDLMRTERHVLENPV